MDNRITIVTAFYDIGRATWDNNDSRIVPFRRTTEQYFDWFSNLANLDNDMIIFSTKDNLEKIKNIRKDKPTIVIELDIFEEFKDMFSKISSVQSSETYKSKLNPAISHQPESWNSKYLLATYLKPYYLNYSVENNLVNTDQVAWLDFGGYRDLELLGTRKEWRYNFNSEKITTFIHERVTADLNLESVWYNNTDHIVGGCFVCNKKLAKTFWQITKDRIDAGITSGLLGNDQTLIADVCKNNIDLFDQIQCGKNIWHGVLNSHNNGPIYNWKKEYMIEKVSELYRSVLRREPDSEGLHYYSNSYMSLEQIEDIMYNSEEGQKLKSMSIWPPLEYMQKKNNGEWPIPWVATQGISKIISNHGDNLIGCEIGTNNGWGLVWLLQNSNNISKIYAIDPFMPYDDTVTGGIMMTQFHQDCVKSNWLLNTKSYSDRIQFIQKTSEDAVNDIEDNSLDFIFIDGDHRYESVKLDVNLYYSKVKSGGIFSGHDWNATKTMDVERAVYEFMEENDIDKNLLNLCEHNAWYWIKP